MPLLSDFVATDRMLFGLGRGGPVEKFAIPTSTWRGKNGGGVEMGGRPYLENGLSYRVEQNLVGKLSLRAIFRMYERRDT